jgi:hypothetical protein
MGNATGCYACPLGSSFYKSVSPWVCLKDCLPGEVPKSVFCHGATSYVRELLPSVWVMDRPLEPAVRAEPTRSYIANCPSSNTGSGTVRARSSQPVASKTAGSTQAATSAKNTASSAKRSSATVSAKFVKASSVGH